MEEIQPLDGLICAIPLQTRQMPPHQSCRMFEQNFIFLNMCRLHGATSQQELAPGTLLCNLLCMARQTWVHHARVKLTCRPLCEWFELCACPCMVATNILEYSLLSNFPWKSNASQTCDTSLVVALPAELRQTSLHLYEKIKVSSFCSFPRPAHKSPAEFLLKLKSYSCIKEEKKGD